MKTLLMYNIKSFAMKKYTNKLVMEDEFEDLGDYELFSTMTDVAIGKTRPSETIRTWNDSELKSIISGNELGNRESGSVVALCEGRGNLSEIGFIAYDLHGNCCYLLQVPTCGKILN